MTIVLTLILIVLAIGLLLRWALTASPASLARIIGLWIPVAVAIVGVALIALRAGPIGSMMLLGAIYFIRRYWQGKGGVRRPSRKTSTVRSAVLEMELDHDTGDLDGSVLVGEWEGYSLSVMERDQLLSLHRSLTDDQESRELLEAYLDRRFSDWRHGADANADNGKRSPAASGGMTEEEAYQILGLERGAAAAEIRQAHRRLMQSMHPDKGGSTFLAARINEAKDVLLTRH